MIPLYRPPEEGEVFNTFHDMVHAAILSAGTGAASLKEIYAACMRFGRVKCRKTGGWRLVTERRNWKSHIRHTLYTTDKFLRCPHDSDSWTLAPAFSQTLPQTTRQMKDVNRHTMLQQADSGLLAGAGTTTHPSARHARNDAADQPPRAGRQGSHARGMRQAPWPPGRRGGPDADSDGEYEDGGEDEYDREQDDDGEEEDEEGEDAYAYLRGTDYAARYHGDGGDEEPLAQERGLRGGAWEEQEEDAEDEAGAAGGSVRRGRPASGQRRADACARGSGTAAAAAYGGASRTAALLGATAAASAADAGGDAADIDLAGLVELGGEDTHRALLAAQEVLNNPTAAGILLLMLQQRRQQQHLLHPSLQLLEGPLQGHLTAQRQLLRLGGLLPTGPLQSNNLPQAQRQRGVGLSAGLGLAPPLVLPPALPPHSQRQRQQQHEQQGRGDVMHQRHPGSAAVRHPGSAAVRQSRSAAAAAAGGRQNGRGKPKQEEVEVDEDDGVHPGAASLHARHDPSSLEAAALLAAVASASASTASAGGVQSPLGPRGPSGRPHSRRAACPPPLQRRSPGATGTAATPGDGLRRAVSNPVHSMADTVALAGVAAAAAMDAAEEQQGEGEADGDRTTAEGEGEDAEEQEGADPRGRCGGQRDEVAVGGGRTGPVAGLAGDLAGPPWGLPLPLPCGMQPGRCPRPGRFSQGASQAPVHGHTGALPALPPLRGNAPLPLPLGPWATAGPGQVPPVPLQRRPASPPQPPACDLGTAPPSLARRSSSSSQGAAGARAVTGGRGVLATAGDASKATAAGVSAILTDFPATGGPVCRTGEAPQVLSVGSAAERAGGPLGKRPATDSNSSSSFAAGLGGDSGEEQQQQQQLLLQPLAQQDLQAQVQMQPVSKRLCQALDLGRLAAAAATVETGALPESDH